jgi:hypothetical protein
VSGNKVLDNPADIALDSIWAVRFDSLPPFKIAALPDEFQLLSELPSMTYERHG